MACDDARDGVRRRARWRAELNSLVGPCIFVAFFAYCIAMMFMSVFSMGISTLLQVSCAPRWCHSGIMVISSIADEEMTAASPYDTL